MNLVFPYLANPAVDIDQEFDDVQITDFIAGNHDFGANIRS